MKRILVFFIVGVVFFGSCSAQNANAQSSNDAQRIVGTWRGVFSGGLIYIYTFNSNGTYELTSSVTVYQRGNYGDSGNYFISESKLIFGNSEATVVDFYLRSDGRVLVFYQSYVRASLWFEKQ